jgi:hypothetical protein
VPNGGTLLHGRRTREEPDCGKPHQRNTNIHKGTFLHEGRLEQSSPTPPWGAGGCMPKNSGEGRAGSTTPITPPIHRICRAASHRQGNTGRSGSQREAVHAMRMEPVHRSDTRERCGAGRPSSGSPRCSPTFNPLQQFVVLRVVCLSTSRSWVHEGRRADRQDGEDVSVALHKLHLSQAARQAHEARIA